MRNLHHITTLPTHTHALVSLAHIPATSSSASIPVILKSYLISDLHRHELEQAVQAERTALVRLSSDDSGDVQHHSSSVARLLAAKVTSKCLTLTMRCAPGIPASDLPRPLPVSRAARITRHLVSALCRVHAADVVHADLAMRNIMVDVSRDDSVCLIDFSSCFLRGEPPRDTSRTTSAHVLAPEILSGSTPHPTADVWGLGIFVWSLVFGGPGPFQGKSDTAIMQQIQAVADGRLDMARMIREACEQLQSHEEFARCSVENFLTTCLSPDLMRRFAQQDSLNGGTAWGMAIDYDRIHSHPFLSLLPD